MLHVAWRLRGSPRPSCPGFFVRLYAPVTTSSTNSAAWVLLALVSATLLWLLAPVLSPFIMAWVFAYASEPLADALARRLPRWAAALVVECLCILGGLAVIFMILPILNDQLPKLRTQLPVLVDQLAAAAAPRLASWGLNVPGDAQSLKDLLVQAMNTNMGSLGATLLNSARLGGSVALAVLGHLVLVPLVWFYLLADWRTLGPKLAELVPARHRAAVSHFTQDCNRMLGQYLRGQLMVMGVLALYYSVGLSLFGFDLAWPIGLFTGLIYFIPYVGFGIGLAMALIAGLLQFLPTHPPSYPLIAVAVVFGGGQILEGFFLTPRWVGKRIGLHPVGVIFVLLACGQLLGFVGVLLALPISAVGMVIARRLLEVYRASHFYLDAGGEGP